MKNGRKKLFYTVYRRSDDEIVAVGDVESCCKQLGITKVNSFYGMISRQRRGKKQKLYVYSSTKWAEE